MLMKPMSNRPDSLSSAQMLWVACLPAPHWVPRLHLKTRAACSTLLSFLDVHVYMSICTLYAMYTYALPSSDVD